MSNIIRLASILCIVCVAAAAALGSVYELTMERIAIEQERVMKDALELVLPDAALIAPAAAPDGKTFFRGFADEDTTKTPDAYAVIAYGRGYSSTIRTLVGIDNAGNILGIKILYQQETPGLGAKSEEVLYGENDSWFQRQFSGKTGLNIAVDKDDGDIRSITGATISSRAVTNSIQEEIAWLFNRGLIERDTTIKR